jgi:hypothetical protein
LTAIRKTLDVNAVFDSALASNTQAIVEGGNQLPRPLIRGDQVLLRWRILQGTSLANVVDLSDVDGFEFVATKIDVFGARTSGDVLLYSAHNQFVPADWSSWSLANGRICCRVNTNTTNLLAAIGTSDTLVIRAGLFATHKLAPPPVDVSSSSSEGSTSSASSFSSYSLSSSSSSSSGIFGPGYLTCLWLGTILVQNDVWRIGQGDLVSIVLDPPSMNSSSSSSSSTEAQTTSSSQSSDSSSDSSLSSASSQSSSSSSGGGQGDFLVMQVFGVENGDDIANIWSDDFLVMQAFN